MANSLYQSLKARKARRNPVAMMAAACVAVSLYVATSSAGTIAEHDVPPPFKPANVETWSLIVETPDGNAWAIDTGLTLGDCDTASLPWQSVEGIPVVYCEREAG